MDLHRHSRSFVPGYLGPFVLALRLVRHVEVLALSLVFRAEVCDRRQAAQGSKPSRSDL